MTNEKERLSTSEQWDDFFDEGGQWEKNRGKDQTRRFAEAFCKHTRICLKSGQTLLDSSCALGDALPVLARRFPQAELSACDFSAKAIQRGKEQFGDYASFFVASLDELTGMYDVILSSNTLEHFADYEDKARLLLQHCKTLCVMVPYDERLEGKDLGYDPEQDHIATFRKDSFDFLLEERAATKVHPPKVFFVPKAWSWSLGDWIREFPRSIVRFLLNRPLARNQKQILFELERKAC